MELDWTTISLQIINFLVLVWLLKRFLYQPVLDVIARRQQGIEQALNDARGAETRAESLRQDYESKLAQLDKDHAAQIDRLADEVAAERSRRLDQLDTELAAERERRAALADKEAAETARKLEQTARESATAFVSRLLGRLSGTGLDDRLVQLTIDDLQALPDDQLAALRSAAASRGTKLQLTTARALTDAEEARLLEALENTLGRRLPVTKSVDPALQSGLRVGIGPWLLAASLADELEFFRCGVHCDE